MSRKCITSSQDGRICIVLWHYNLSSLLTPSFHPFRHSKSYRNLLGAREDSLLAVYARQITEKVVEMRPPTSAEPLPTIILAISLHKEKGKDTEMFGLLVDLLVQLYRDAVTGSY
jgi:hypothetical protein